MAGKTKRKQAKQIEVRFPPAFVKEFVTDKGKNLADFKKEVMDMYKGKTPIIVDANTMEEIVNIITLLADPDKVSHGMNEIKFYGVSDINGRLLATKLIECSKALNKIKNDKQE